jgi:hypothetical protein
MTWATTTDVSDVTGVTVTASALTYAESDICVFANRSPDASANMSVRDLYWMKMATCYQAAWRDSQVKVEGRQGLRSMSQSGQSVDYQAEWQVTLGPMAARSLRNLSWKADRTKRTPNIRYPRGLGQLDAMVAGVGYKFLDESYDEANVWVEME